MPRHMYRVQVPLDNEEEDDLAALHTYDDDDGAATLIVEEDGFEPIQDGKLGDSRDYAGTHHLDMEGGTEPEEREATGLLGMLRQLDRMIYIYLICGISLIIIIAGAAASAQPHPQEGPTAGRLSRDVVPNVYRIHIEPDIEGRTFQGNVVIFANVTSSTRSITMHSSGLTIINVAVRDSWPDGVKSPDWEPENTLDVEGFSLDNATETLTIRLAKRRNSGSKLAILVRFNGTFPEDSLEGMYLSSYRDSTGREHTLLTTQFESVYARRAFPCFDEPDFKAKFQISVKKPAGMIALGNMPPTADVPRAQAGRVIFEITPAMSTYLVALILTDMEYTEATAQNAAKTPVRVFAAPERVEQTRYALDIAARAVALYEQKLKVPYALPKLDLIAIPDFAAGAMENWGLVTFRETALLVNQTAASVTTTQWVAAVVCHELAHQWFGNLVTMAWWGDLWLNEGFATFFEQYAVSQLEPSFSYWQQFVSMVSSAAKGADTLRSTHALSTPPSSIYKVADIENYFDSITYEKGGSVLRMVYALLGEDDFFACLSRYLEENRYSNVVSHDLWRSIDRCLKDSDDGHPLPASLQTLLDTWTSEPGVPRISLTLEQDGRHWQATQAPFRTQMASTASDASPKARSSYRRSVRSADDDVEWAVPISWVTASSAAARNADGDTSCISYVAWLRKLKGRLDTTSDCQPDTDEWYVINPMGAGYYIVDYSEHQLAMIANALQEDMALLTPAERANVLDDAFRLAEANQGSTVEALKLVSYFDQESHIAPVSIVVGVLSRLWRMFGGNSDTAAYIERILGTLASSVLVDDGWRVPPQDYMKASNQEMVLPLLCLSGSSICDDADVLFEEYMQGSSELQPHVAQTVLEVGVRRGGGPEWEFVYNRYVQETDANLQRRYLHALAVTSDVSLQQRLLDASLNASVIRSQDTVTAIALVALSGPQGLDAAMSFAEQRWDDIAVRVGSRVTRMLRYFAAATYDRATFDRLTKLVEAHSANLSEDAVALLNDLASDNVAWATSQGSSIAQYLASLT